MNKQLRRFFTLVLAALASVQVYAQTTIVIDATGVSATGVITPNEPSGASTPGRLSHVAVLGCPIIACPSNVTTVNDNAACGAVVNFSTPTATDPCAVVSDTFSYSGSIVTWTVPAGVTSVHIETRGAQGGYNTSSTTQPGMGAMMSGDFTVTPGQQLKILVGQQPSNGSGNGGGGGTFVTDNSNNPLIVAGGGGGSSQGNDSPDKHGQTTTSGGTGAGGGGVGGTAGSGGSVGSSGFQSGAGGGLLTNGANGWTTNTGGLAFVNGGSGGTTNAPANGGFGGGGSGSSYVVGGGGGGYSGGGSGGNTTAGVGGGGGSYNAGTNQLNASGVNTGNGLVVISYTDGSSLTLTQIAGLSSGSFFPVGTTVQTFVANDGLGNTDTCSFTVTVIDTASPSIVCPSNITASNDTLTCFAVVTFSMPGAIDNCAATVSQTGGLPSGSAFPVGTNTITYTATDASGNTSSCSFDIIVVDDEAPMFACPGTLTVPTDSGMCDAVVNFNMPVATDNCSGASVVQTSGPVSGSTFALGTTTVTFMATDSAGNTSTCSFDIVVTDMEAPLIVCGNNITTCENVQTLIAANASDVCSGVATITYTLTGATTGSGSNSATLVFNVGVTTVTYTATDSAGNSSSCMFTVTVSANPTVNTSASNANPCVDDGLVTLTASPAGGLWTGTAVSGSTFNPSTAGNGTHVLLYQFTDSLGCTTTDTLTIVVSPCVGITDNNGLSNMSVSPNPANGIMTISFGAMYTNVQVTLTQVNGQVVKQEMHNSTSVVNMDLTDVASGVYFLTVKADDGWRTVKIIRE